MKLTANVEIEIQSTAEKIFQAWIESEMIACWMFGPSVREESIVHLQCDPRPGGLFSFLVERNGTRIDHVGKYLIVDAPFKLQFTWAIDRISEDDSIVTVEIHQHESYSILTIQHEIQPEWAEYLDRTRLAWEKMSALLKKRLENND